MTSQGSAWPRLRRALDKGNLIEARSAASELEHVWLGEALELVLLIRDQEPAKFERAALRWHARLCAEVRAIKLGEAVTVLALLERLQDERGDKGPRALADLSYRRGTEPACKVLKRWADRQSERR